MVCKQRHDSAAWLWYIQIYSYKNMYNFITLPFNT